MLRRSIVFIVFALGVFVLVLPGNNIISSDSKLKEPGFSLFEPGSSLNISSLTTRWVDSVYNSLSLEERIAQLLMIRVQTDQDDAYYSRIEDIVDTYNVGGLAFFRGGPKRQLKLTNHLQSVAKTPMLIAMDAEWGLSMRLDSTISFPKQMTLGAIRGERYIYEMGMHVGYQAKRLGVHINFAPVVDVNNNPANPVINFRSFGECRYNVTRKGLAYMKGMQASGIIACAKHFPGHGDTDADSHFTLPVINHSYEEIDSIHVYPFRHLIDNGLLSVMVAHLNIPALDRQRRIPSTLSPKIVTNLLKKELDFMGLVITDALDMKGVTNYMDAGEIELAALKAGNDILLLPQDVEAAINTIANAINSGDLSEDILEQKVKKILFYKHALGLNNYEPQPVENLYEHLNLNKSKVLNRRLAQLAITVLKNNQNTIPLKDFTDKRIASLAIGSKDETAFQQMLANYAPVSLYNINKEATNIQQKTILKKLADYDMVIVSVHGNSLFASRKYGITGNTADIIKAVAAQNNTILNLFANPYSLEFLHRESIINLNSIIISYEEGKTFEEASAQIIFGALAARGRLPVSIPVYANVYNGIQTPALNRVRFGEAEEVGINSKKLEVVDSIALDGIKEGAYPGCQIVIIKDGTVIYNKSFGYHTYHRMVPVKNSDIFDLASLTKIAATTLTIMKLYDEGKLDINQSLGYYLPWLQGTNYEGIEIREILAHQAMLRSWIPFYINTLENFMPSSNIYQRTYSEQYPTQVANNLFIHRSFKDSIYNVIMDTPLLDEKRYVYSDLGFILMSDLIKEVTGETIDNYVQKKFYKPLGLSTIGYLPLNRFPASRIVPSEHDTVFRKQVLRGHVHDPAAAMLGGVSGHAGLFGNAMDVAIIMEMLIRGGIYQGENFINQGTVNKFTSVQFPCNKNRRGLGFDKPNINENDFLPVCKSASSKSFGHSGFTGTYAWADPKENLVFVFLSNRTFPNSANRKIIDMDIRNNIHQAVYDAILSARYIETTKSP